MADDKNTLNENILQQAKSNLKTKYYQLFEDTILNDFDPNTELFSNVQDKLHILAEKLSNKNIPNDDNFLNALFKNKEWDKGFRDNFIKKGKVVGLSDIDGLINQNLESYNLKKSLKSLENEKSIFEEKVLKNQIVEEKIKKEKKKEEKMDNTELSLNQVIEKNSKELVELYEKAIESNTSKSKPLNNNQLAQLNKLKDSILINLDKVFLEEKMSPSEIMEYKEKFGLKRLEGLSFDKDLTKSEPYLLDFVKNLKGESKDADRISKLYLERSQTHKDIFDYFNETYKNEKNPNNISKDPVYKLMEKKFHLDSDFFTNASNKDKLNKIKSELAGVAENSDFYTELQKIKGFKNFQEEKNQQFINDHKSFFANLPKNEDEDLAKKGRMYKEVGGLEFKDAMFAAKMTYKAFFPHTIVTGLIFKAIKSSGMVDVMKNYMKNKLEEAKKDTLLWRWTKRAMILSAMATSAVLLVAVAPEDTLEMLKETPNGLKNLLGSETLGATDTVIEKQPNISEIENSHIVKEVAVDKEAVAVEKTVPDTQPATTDDINKALTETKTVDTSDVDVDSPSQAVEKSTNPTVSKDVAFEHASVQVANTMLEESIVGKPLPVGNIYQNGTMDLIKELNPQFANPDLIIPGQEVRLPTFGLDEQGNRIITGFESKTVMSGDTLSDMYVDHATGQMSQIQTVQTQPSAVFETKSNTLVVDNASKTVAHVDNEGNMNLYKADEAGVVAINDEQLRKEITEKAREKFTLTVVDPETGNLVTTKTSSLSNLGFVTEGGTKDGFKIASINSPEIAQKVMNGETITPAEYEEVKKNVAEFKKENPEVRRLGSRIRN